MPLPRLLACQLGSGTGYRSPRRGLEAITADGGLQGLLWRDTRLEEGSSEEGEVARHQQAGFLPALQRQYPVQSLREVRLITPGAPREGGRRSPLLAVSRGAAGAAAPAACLLLGLTGRGLQDSLMPT